MSSDIISYRLNNPVFKQMDIGEDYLVIRSGISKWYFTEWYSIQRDDRSPFVKELYTYDGVIKAFPECRWTTSELAQKSLDHQSRLKQFLNINHAQTAYKVPEEAMGFVYMIVHHNEVSLFHRLGYDIVFSNNEYSPHEKQIIINETYITQLSTPMQLDSKRLWSTNI
jgi:hypothetical protein